MTDRAVVLAGGRGTRLGAATASTPKPLLEVGGRPIIEHILEGIAEAGIYRVAVVTGYMANLLEDTIWGMGGLSIEFIRQPEPRGTADAISLARDFTQGQRFFFTWGDILVDPVNHLAAIESAAWADAVLAVTQVEDPTHGAAVYVAEDFTVERIVEKPEPGTSTTNWNNAGFGVLGERIWEHIDQLRPSARGELELPAAVRSMIDAGAKVLAMPVQGPWFDIGTPASLAAARRHYERSG